MHAEPRSRPGCSGATAALEPSLAGPAGPRRSLVDLPGGAFLMGDDSVWAYPDDGEGPVHEVVVRPLRVDPMP